ncbi:MAG: hypothetical protein H2184_08795 [Candidatus Galacturonibacter soehngenii]|nr:hypothetical protein [Candidatus Galacturonibacter soehngenii]
MASIAKYLNNILSAVYGKDVRQSIHDSIKKINEEVESNQEAEAERVNAEKNRVTAENEREAATTDALNKIHIAISDSEESTENALQATAEANTATSNMQEIINDMNNKIASDYYRGKQGIKGDKGDRGDSGIIVPINGMFTLSSDEEGNVYANYTDEESPPIFEVEEINGEKYVYYIIPD